MCLCVSMVMHEKEGQPSSHPPLALHSPHLCINRSLFSHAPPPSPTSTCERSVGGSGFNAVGLLPGAWPPPCKQGALTRSRVCPEGHDWEKGWEGHMWGHTTGGGAHRAHNQRGSTQETQLEGGHMGHMTEGGVHEACDWRGGTQWGHDQEAGPCLPSLLT